MLWSAIRSNIWNSNGSCHPENRSRNRCRANDEDDPEPEVEPKQEVAHTPEQVAAADAEAEDLASANPKAALDDEAEGIVRNTIDVAAIRELLDQRPPF